MSKPIGTCCAVLTVALERFEDARHGLTVAQRFGIRDGAARGEALIVNMRKAKRGEDTAYPELAKATFAECRFCPFCGHEFGERIDEKQEGLTGAQTGGGS